MSPVDIKYHGRTFLFSLITHHVNRTRKRTD